MKKIGVNQWVGADPWFADTVRDLQQQAERTRQAASERWRRMSPSDKFFHLANDRFENPRLFGIAPVKGYWQIGDWTLAEISPVSLEDARDSKRCLVHLQSLYVVDMARGKGEGKRSIEEIKKIADECGCGVRSGQLFTYQSGTSSVFDSSTRGADSRTCVSMILGSLRGRRKKIFLSRASSCTCRSAWIRCGDTR